MSVAVNGRHRDSDTDFMPNTKYDYFTVKATTVHIVFFIRHNGGTWLQALGLSVDL